MAEGGGAGGGQEREGGGGEGSAGGNAANNLQKIKARGGTLEGEMINGTKENAIKQRRKKKSHGEK